MNCRRIALYQCVALLASLFTTEATAQLVYQQKMDKFSAVLPLTLDNDVYRVRCKPPEGVAPRDISCDIGITGTVLTDQRGTSSTGSGEKVVAELRSRDNIDVQFSDRVHTGNHDYVGNRIIEKYDFDCGINIKYQNKLKIAQVEIRVGYLLPSGDREGFTWAKLSRKRRQFADNIARCVQCEQDLADLNSTRGELLSTVPDNGVQRTLIQARLTGINRQIDRKTNYAHRKGEFERDLAAFNSVTEYLKTKVIGCQVYVYFRYKDDTLPVDIEELKRSHIRPIQVFEDSKDPIKNREATEK